MFRPKQFSADVRADSICVNRALTAAAGALLVLLVAGCSKSAPAAPAAPQAMPVATQPVALGDVPQRDTYVATIKSRRTTTMQPQVDGSIDPHPRA